jgi:hypothetical protein
MTGAANTNEWAHDSPMASAANTNKWAHYIFVNAHKWAYCYARTMRMCSHKVSTQRILNAALSIL